MAITKKSKEYHAGAEEMREKLNAISPSFCLAKWMMVSMHLTNGKTQSCYHPPAHDIPIEGLSENPGLLHNTEFKIKERKQMRNGERPDGCKYCWAAEDAPSAEKLGHLSDRHYKSSEWWAADQLEKIQLGDERLDKGVTPAYVEVNFNQACNFKCIYCSPHISSEWQKEIEIHGDYRLEEYIHNNIEALKKVGLMPLTTPNNENPFVQSFWKWWPQIYKDLKVFRMTGGEPLLDVNTWKVLDYAHQNPNADLELSITSNLCPPKSEIFEKFILKLQKLEKIQIWEDSDKLNKNTGNYGYVSPAIKYFMLFVSCDSVGAQAEYIRTGMNFNVVKNNIREVLSKTDGTAITLINTFNVLSLPKLKDFLSWILELREEFCYENQKEEVIQVSDPRGILHKPYTRKKRQRVWFDIPILSQPSWLSIKLMANTEWEKHLSEIISFMEENVQKDDYDTSYRGFKPYEILKVKRNFSIMKQSFEPEELNINKRRFVEYVNELDRRRATNFLQIFPELENFYKSINSTKDKAYEK
ncbi:twitch domain-containing radical SAM protein [bacterium]|nr:twitch domain-containing radical SAM protein [bacterium]